jgi:ligand-binding SRPBCC domain-containing protein
MGANVLTSIQKMPISLDEAWAFFSSPKNLGAITPPEMDFKITNDLRNLDMYAGQAITYKVKPLLGIPIFWMTEISHVEDRKFFIDNQRVGPYKIWHHQHHFKAIEGGVEMIDIVTFKSPMGWLGSIADALFVRNKVKSIFDYRYEKIEERFGKFPNQEKFVAVTTC